MEWIERLLEIVDKRLGKTTSNLMLWVVTLGLIAAGLLWFTTFAIDRIDWLADRFNINVFIESIDIPLIGLGDFGSLLLIGIVMIVFMSGIAFSIATPILLIVRGGIDASQRGKVENLLNKLQVVLINAKSNIPQQIPELENAINEIEQIKMQPSVFRRIQSTFSFRRKEGRGK